MAVVGWLGLARTPLHVDFNGAATATPRRACPGTLGVVRYLRYLTTGKEGTPRCMSVCVRYLGTYMYSGLQHLIYLNVRYYLT